VINSELLKIHERRHCAVLFWCINMHNNVRMYMCPSTIRGCGDDFSFILRSTVAMCILIVSDAVGGPSV